MSRCARLVVLLLLLLTACGGGATGEDQGQQEQSPGDSPLAEFFGYDEESFDAEDYAEQERRMQELLVACMAEEGFTYTPVDYPDPVEDPAFAAQQELSPEEYAAEYGYGFTTVNHEGQAEQEGEEYTDPNMERVDAMSEAERAAYETALYGEMPEIAPGEEGEAVEYGFGGGCQGEASEEVYGGSDPEVQEELSRGYEQLYERIEADSRMVEGNAAWAECMREAGYDFATQQEAQESIWQQQDALYNEAYEAAPPPSEGLEEEYVEPEIDEARLAELRETEIATAVADQRCTAEHLPEELRLQVAAEYEQAFIDENRGLLERERDAMKP